MIPSRAMSRSTGAVRGVPRAIALRNGTARGHLRQVRFQTSQAQTPPPQSGGNSAFVGGLAGGAVVFILGYGYYYFSGTRSIVNTATQTKKQLDKVVQTVKDQAPEPNEALKWFRQTVTTSSAAIPGAKPYVDAFFDDIDKVEQNHRDELNKIVSSAHSEVKSALKGGLTVETAKQTWAILSKYMEQVGALAGDSASEILDNHPQVKEKVAPHLDQLRSMAKSYGPEAKEQLDQMYAQIKDLLTKGVNADTANKIRSIVQENFDKMKEMGDKAWKKALEQAKPYFDKNPELKKVVEESAETLKQGNFSELQDKIKNGDLEQLKQYIQQVSQQAMKQGSQNLQQYAKFIPGGDKVLPKLGKLQEVAEKRGDQAQKILKETYEEVAEVLRKKTEEIEGLGEEVKGDVKKEVKEGKKGR